MSEPLLAVRGVKSFYGNIMALKGVALDVHAGEIGLDDRPRRIIGVVHVHRGREATAAEARLTLEDVTEQLVDLAPHALEVRE